MGKFEDFLLQEKGCLGLKFSVETNRNCGNPFPLGEDRRMREDLGTVPDAAAAAAGSILPSMLPIRLNELNDPPYSQKRGTAEAAARQATRVNFVLTQLIDNQH